MAETAQRPEKDWTRERRIEWAREKFGEGAQYFWVVYRLDGAANFPMKLCDFSGLEFDETAFAKQYGSGRFRRQLRVRGVQDSFVTEDFGIDPAMIPRDVRSGPVFDAPDRLDALAAKLAALESRVAPSPAAGLAGLGSVRDLIEVARIIAPPAPPAPVQGIESIMAAMRQMRLMARELYDEAPPEPAGEGGGGIGRFLEGLAAKFMAAPPVPPAPPAPPASTPANLPGAAPRPSLPEPFPGAAAIAASVPTLAAQLPPTAGRDGLAPELIDTLADALAETIDTNMGSAVAVAERFRTGDALAEALGRFAPQTREWAGLLAIIGQRFVEIQLAPDEPPTPVPPPEPPPAVEVAPRRRGKAAT